MAKTAVVTGGTRGIGKAISVKLNQIGYNVIANYAKNEAAAEAFRAETGLEARSWDVCSYEECETELKKIEDELGPIDVLINNAGVTRDVPFHKMTADQWHVVLQTDLSSVFNMTRPLINGMREREYGRIINISSVNAQKGQFGQTNYSAAKSGLLGFTRSLALETAKKGITVNAVAPGYVATDMLNGLSEKVLSSIIGQIPMCRLGNPEEIAECVAFLASEQASFITGSVLSANGGQYIAA